LGEETRVAVALCGALGEIIKQQARMLANQSEDPSDLDDPTTRFRSEPIEPGGMGIISEPTFLDSHERNSSEVRCGVAWERSATTIAMRGRKNQAKFLDEVAFSSSVRLHESITRARVQPCSTVHVSQWLSLRCQSSRIWQAIFEETLYSGGFLEKRTPLRGNVARG
jgi:hypothetical protein